jgi:hypothetical protein
MATPHASYRNPQPLTLIDHVDRIMHDTSCPQPVKFDAAFLERRMQAHREWQQQETADLATGIILEVAIALEEIA